MSDQLVRSEKGGVPSKSSSWKYPVRSDTLSTVAQKCTVILESQEIYFAGKVIF